MGQAMDDLMLPPLPEPELSDIALEKADANGICPVISYYTADQMREYAKAAVEADRATRIHIQGAPFIAPSMKTWRPD